jgi:hypothetical protein
VSQLLYIHNRIMDSFNTRDAGEVLEWARAYSPVDDDPDFLQNLYRRGEISRRSEEARKDKKEFT